MCKCGCNSCETDSTALVLKESKFVHTPVSDGLKYHIDNKIPLNENIYRIGSKEYMKLYEEARSLYSRNKLDVSKDDKYFLTETHVGNFGIFEGKKVPLDIPMLEEEVNSGDLDNAIYRLEKVYKYLDIKYKETQRGEKYIQINYIPVTSPQSQNPEFVNVRYSNDEDLEVIKKRLDIPMLNEVEVGDIVKIDKAYGGGKGEVKDKKGSFIVVNGSSYHESDVKLIKEYSDGDNNPSEDDIAQAEFGMDYNQLGPNEKEWVRDEYENINNFNRVNEILDEKLKGIDGKACWKGYKLSGTKKKDGKTVDNCVPMEESLNEKEGVPHYTKDGKEWKGKVHKMPDGSLMSGNPHDKNGSGPNGKSEKLYHKEDLNENKKDTLPVSEAEFKGKEVALGKPKRGGPKAYYVYVKDGDKVKKVTFGSGGLRAKIKNKDARSAFAARHNCDKKKDRTTAGYWSCNLPKYAKQLGLGANMNTYW